jgi:hypothetical protein
MMRDSAVAATAIAIIAGLGAGTASAGEDRSWKPHSHHQTKRRADMHRHVPVTEVVRSILDQIELADGRY